MIITARKVTEYDMHVSKNELRTIKYALGIIEYSNTAGKETQDDAAALWEVIIPLL